MSREQESESVEESKKTELSGERKKFQIAFHEVGTVQNAIIVRALAAHPEGLTVNATWEEVVSMLGSENRPIEDVTALLGTFDRFKMNIVHQFPNVILQEKKDNKPKTLRLNPEYTDMADMVSDMTLTSTEENWIPSAYFLRDVRIGPLYEPTRIHVARYLRQELLDENGNPRTNRVLRIRDIQNETGVETQTASAVLNEFARLHLCNFISFKKGESITQLSLVAAPDDIDAVMNERRLSVGWYPEFPLDLISVMQDLGGENLRPQDIELRLNKLYEDRYKKSYKKTTLYTRVNKYLKQLEREGSIVRDERYVEREGRRVSLIRVPEDIAERVEKETPTLPELPHAIITFFQDRQAKGNNTVSYQEINRAMYTSYVQTHEGELSISYPAFCYIVSTMLNTLIDGKYIEKQTQPTAITITPENDRNILLDVTEDYNLLLQKDPEFLRDIHTRAQAISEDPQRLRAVLLDAAGFAMPTTEHEVEPIERQITAHEEREQAQVQHKIDMRQGEEVKIQLRRPTINQKQLEGLLTQFTESDGSEIALAAVLNYIAPMLNYAITLYEGFGRSSNDLYGDALYAVNERLQALLTGETNDKVAVFHPFAIATASMRYGIQEQVAQNARFDVPEDLREAIHVAEQILGTQSISVYELGMSLVDEAQNEDSAIRIEDISRILFTFRLRQLSMESTEKHLTRLQLSKQTRHELQEAKETHTREKVRQLLVQGSGITYATVRAHLKSIHEPIPQNLREIISQVRQNIAETGIGITMTATSSLLEAAAISDTEPRYRRRRQNLIDLTLKGGTMTAITRENSIFDKVIGMRVGREFFEKYLIEHNLPSDTESPITFTVIDKYTVMIGINNNLRVRKLENNRLSINVEPGVQTSYTLLLRLSLQHAREMDAKRAGGPVNAASFSDAASILEEAAELQEMATQRKIEVSPTPDIPVIIPSVQLPEKTVEPTQQPPVISEELATPDSPEHQEPTIVALPEVIPESPLARAELFFEQGGALIVNEETHTVQIFPYSSDPASEYKQMRIANPSIGRDTTNTDIHAPLRITDGDVEHYVSVLEGSQLIDYYMGEESKKRPKGVFNNWNRTLYVLRNYIADPTFAVRGMSDEMMKRLKETAETAEWTGIEIIFEGKKRGDSTYLLGDTHELENL